ncbi:MAG: efflux RND transporter periplasmic adaptor subunit [Victivallales bacterium]|nr:efflux RND transporter periplasmic adaptor subunit [Victivallales bacterium]
MKTIILSVFTAGAVLLGLCSCEEKKEIREKPARPVKWVVLNKAEADVYVSLPGEVQATQCARLAFQVPGQIMELPIIIGQKVEEGQLLARLDDKKYRSELDKALAVERKAKVDYERYRKLNADRVVSDKEYEQKRRNYAVAISERKIAQKNQNDTQLKAPFAGIIANKSVKNYQNVKAEEKIIVLQDLEHLEIVVHVPVRQIRPDNKDELKMYAVVNNFPKLKFDLKIREFSTEIDPDTLTYEVTLAMIIPEEHRGKILPGMLANVFFTKGEDKRLEGSFFLPVQAVVADAHGKKFVWVIAPDKMTVSRREVITDVLADDKILITGGLKKGEMVAVSGATFLVPGQKVKKYQRLK